jgi:hypothetical protein
LHPEEKLRTLIVHAHNFCPGTHIHFGISACLAPLLQQKDTHTSLPGSLKDNVQADKKST